MAWNPYYQQHSAITAQPPPAGYWAQPHWGPTQTQKKLGSGFLSPKYPNLNPVLAVDTTLVRVNVSKKPRTDIPPSSYQTHRNAPATHPPCTHMRLVSKSLPWTIELVVQPGSHITCEAVWDALYAALQEHIVDSEWGFIVGDRKKRDVVDKAAKKRMERDLDPRLKRVDYLGDHLLLKGLEKDDEFVRLRVMKGVDPCAETWAVKFGAL